MKHKQIKMDVSLQVITESSTAQHVHHYTTM